MPVCVTTLKGFVLMSSLSSRVAVWKSQELGTGGQLTKVLRLGNSAGNTNGEGQAGVWPLLCRHGNGQQWNLSRLHYILRLK